MKAYRLSRTARADLRGIASYIAQGNPPAAARWLEAMETRFALLATQPEMGQRCDDLRPGLRRISAGNYVVYFRTEAGRVRVIRVLHGARDIQGLL